MFSRKPKAKWNARISHPATSKMATPNSLISFVLQIHSLSSIFLCCLASSSTAYDDKLDIFKDCLLIWKQFGTSHFNVSTLPNYQKQAIGEPATFPTFYSLLTSHYSKTPYLFQVGFLHNISKPLKQFNIAALPRAPLQHTKYLPCHVIFHEVQLHKLHPVILWTGGEEDSRFIVYFSNAYHPNLPKFLHNYMYHLNYSGTPFYLDHRGTLNFPFYTPEQINIPLETFIKTIPELETFWNKVLQRLHGITLITGNTAESSLKCAKTLRDDDAEITKIKSLCALKSHLNLTFSLIPSLTIQKIDVLSSAQISQSVTGTLHHFRSCWFRYVLSTPGFEIQAFAFLIVTTETFHHSLSGLSQPFQVSVWIAIFVALFSTPLALMLTCGTSPWNAASYLEWTFLTLASLVDQCNDDIRGLFKTSKSAVLWLLWNFFSLVVMNSYDGQLYSFLASKQDLHMPNSLEELAAEKIPVATISTFIRYSNNGSVVPESTLLELLRPPNFQKYLGKGDDPKEIERVSNNKLIRLPMFYKELAKLVTHFSTFLVPFLHTSKKLADFGKAQKSKVFAVVDKDSRVKLVDPVLGMWRKIKVVKRQVIRNFINCESWLVRKFYLFRRIEFVLWQIKESGLFQLWNNNFLLSTQKIALVSMLNADGNENMGKSFNLISYLEHQSKLGQGGRGNVDTGPAPMPLKLLVGVIRLSMMAMSASIIIIILENICFILSVTLGIKKETQFAQRILIVEVAS